MAEFTIEQSETVKFIFIQKGSEDKKVDISSADKISAIVTAIKV